MKILIDIDNTLCDNMGAWLAIYNEESRDTLVPEDIKTWDIESYLKPDYVKFFWEVAYPSSFTICLGIYAGQCGVSLTW
jgi:5'(3')-deoxyribonucleotidase